jgi:uncharacterized membrane protein
MVARINFTFGVVFVIVGVVCLMVAPRRSAVAARQLRSAAVACFIAIAVLVVLHFITSY